MRLAARGHRAARPFLIGLVCASCAPDIQPGFFRCDDFEGGGVRGCPDDWYCHSNGLCYPTPESTGTDAGQLDAGRPDAARDASSIADAAPRDTGGPASDAGPSPECKLPRDCPASPSCASYRCTSGRCELVVGTGCLIASICRDAGEQNPDNECEFCDPMFPAMWSPRAGMCDDGNRCTTDDVCDEGTCVGTAVPEGGGCDAGGPTQICCGGRCIDWMVTRTDCGSCFIECAVGVGCDDGYCAPCVSVADCPISPVGGWECDATTYQCRCTGNPACPAGQTCDLMTGRCTF